MYWDREAGVNSVDPDQMLQNTASDLGLPSFPHIQQVLDILISSKTDLFKF